MRLPLGREGEDNQISISMPHGQSDPSGCTLHFVDMNLRSEWMLYSDRTSDLTSTKVVQGGIFLTLLMKT